MKQKIDQTRRPLVCLLGNQLFPTKFLKAFQHAPVFMAEDQGLCTYVRHHKQKLVFVLSAAVAVSCTFVGMFWSYVADLPTNQAICFVSGCVFVAVVLIAGIARLARHVAYRHRP